MRGAMAAAEVGDDVFGDDPTLNRLEAVAAERLGKESALYVPSGTMANLVGVLTHTRPGEEVLLGEDSHIFNFEVGGAARIGGLQMHALPNLPGGGLPAEAIGGAIRAVNIHASRTALLCLENTHNLRGGAVLDVDEGDALAEIAHGSGLRVHLDGARIFNAEVALGVPAARIARESDSVSFCLSKGLGCPVGSLLCGTKEYIAEARRNRKMLGGGMRQAGMLAAAGLYALEHNVERMREDHANARRLAEGLGGQEAFATNSPQTNIVIVDVLRGTVDEWLKTFRAAGVLAVGFGPRRMRMVTHLDVSGSDIVEALKRIAHLSEAIPA